MSQYAQLPDGTQLEFPDDTRPEVMQAAVKKMLGVPAVPGIPKPMLPPGMMTEQQRASADAAVNAGHDLRHEDLRYNGYDRSNSSALDAFARMTRPGASEKAGALSDLAGSVANAMAPLALAAAVPAAISAPLATAGAVAGGIGGATVAQRIAKALGAGEGWQQAAGDIGGVLGGGLGIGAAKRVPSRARAMQNFQTVMQAAGGVPISTSQVAPIVDEALTLGKRGSNVPKVTRDLAERLTKPGASPIDYSESRDFASNASRLTPEEAMTTDPRMKEITIRLSKALNAANEGAANSAQVGDEYRSAMKEYSRAKRMENAGELVKQYGIKALLAAALGASGAGLGIKAYKELAK